MKNIKIGNKLIGDQHPCYTIAEIGSNFDRSLAKAKRLIDLAIESGADAVKFQSFKAENLVNDDCFKNLKIGYQLNWDKSVFDVYKNAEFPVEFHKDIFDYCQSKKIEFFSAPYDKESVDFLDKLGVKVFKIGSGDITWLENIEYIAKKNKPILLATGASDVFQIDRAMKVIRSAGNNQIVLMQCVTNYPASFNEINLKVLPMFREKFDCLVGYSDHSPGTSVAIGTVAMGGCVIEKHFTDDKSQHGPDHSFAMDPKDFRKMVDDIRHMEKILGKPQKIIYDEEKPQYVSMKRGLKAKISVAKGTILKREHINVLRPCQENTVPADKLNEVLGKTLSIDLEINKPIKFEYFK
jgi:N-acetylneuraminate synthase